MTAPTRASVHALWYLLLALGALGSVAAAEPSEQLRPYSVTFEVYPPNASVSVLSRDGDTSAVGKAWVPLGFEEKPSLLKEAKVPVVFEVPQWFGGTYRTRSEFLSEENTLKKRYPVSQQSGRLSLPAWVAFQAWTLAYPVLSVLGLLSFLTALVLVVKGRALVKEMRTHRGGDGSSKDSSMVGDYQLVDKIGEGGMGEVWAASSVDQLRCALKFIKADLAGDPDFKKRLEREIKVCLPLNHPHLLKLHGYGVATDGRLYTVSELLEGQTLKQLIASGDYDPPQLASKVVEEIGDALGYLHERKLVHRDVKPDNIFVCNNGSLKLMDMGLLRGEEVRTKVTHTGQMLGTPAYMPPEQLGTVGFSGAADQYSLGIIVYEILTGQRPFTQPDPVLIAYQHAHVAPEPPSQHQPRITPEVEAAILRMLEKSPEARFASIAEVQQALEVLCFVSWAQSSEDTQAGPRNPSSATSAAGD